MVKSQAPLRFESMREPVAAPASLLMECWGSSHNGQVLKLFTDDTIATNTPFQTVQDTTFVILERQKLVDIANHIAANATFDETAHQWDHVEKLSGQFKGHLRPILLMVAKSTD